MLPIAQLSVISANIGLASVVGRKNHKRVRAQADSLESVNHFPNASIHLFDQSDQLCTPVDVNGDGTTNVLDLIDLLLCFGLPAVPGCEAEDVNTDGTVNVLDLIELLLEFGNACP